MLRRAHSLRFAALPVAAVLFGLGCSETGLPIDDVSGDASADGADTLGDGGDSAGDTSGDTRGEGGDADAACAIGYASCAEGCVDVLYDRRNCGACGRACAGEDYCRGGACTAICAAPLVTCGSRCVDPRHDPANCGSCGTTCVGGEVCGDKGCALGCPGAQTKCGASCYDTNVDPKNCGGCGKACKTGEVCGGGICATTCTSPLVGCAGACVNSLYDPNNCGGCGVKCVASACVEGLCGGTDSTDDDHDTISNYDEGKADKIDTDGDGTPDYLDLDSDNDTLLDAIEAGDSSLITPPVDSDGDRLQDFRDLDSDNDGLPDKYEATYLVPGHSLPGKVHTDATRVDTDGDTYTDLEEEMAGTDPLDPASTPTAIGGFSFDAPYKGLERTQPLTFRPTIKKADVGYLIDTTGSMGGTIRGVQTNLKSIATKLQAKIPDTTFALAELKDFPISPYGDVSDFPFKLHQRVTSVIGDVQTAVDSLSASGGADLPESQIEAMYQALVGSGFKSRTGAVWTPKFDPTLGFDAAKGNGTIGGMGFRKDSAPILIVATDATSLHAAGDTEAPDNGGAIAHVDPSLFGATDDTMPHTVKQVVAAYAAIGAKMIGISVEDYDKIGAAPDSPRPELEYFALKTGAFIASADGATCPNGVGGVAVAARDDGSGKKVCPLVFGTDSSGAGIDVAIVDAITKLATRVSFKTVWLEARKTSSLAFDETKFFKGGIPKAFEVPLPAGCGAPAIADLLPAPTGDGTLDSFTTLCPGTVITFDLVMQNTDVPAKCEDQVFAFKVVVIGDRTVETDSHVVTVRVPGAASLCKF